MALIALAIGWLVGLLLAASAVAPLLLGGMAALAGLLAWRWRATPVVVWIFLALVAAALANQRYALYQRALDDNPVAAYTQRSLVRLSGVVAGDPTPFASGTEFTFDVRALEKGGQWQPASGLVLVRSADDVSFLVGDRLEVAGVLLPPDPQLPPNQSRLRQEGIVAIANHPTFTPLGDWDRSPASQIGRLRAAAAGVLNRALPEPEAGLARGVALGQRGTLSPALATDFSRTNTSHILAVDGFKVGLVAGFFGTIFPIFLSPLLSALGTVGAIGLFVAFVGATPSALRAAIMGGIFAVGRAFGRPQDTLNGLALAALLMTVANPFLPWNLAFQLSFATTIGLTALTPVTQRWLPHRMGLLREPIAATIAAEIASAPLIVASFNQLSLASLPVHAIVMPLLPFAVFLSDVTAVVGLLAPALANAVGLLAWVPLALIASTVQWAGELPLAALAIPSLGLSAVVGAYLVLGLAILSRPNPLFGPGLPVGRFWRLLTGAVPARILVPGLALPVILAAAVLLRAASPTSTVRFLSVPAGDATLVQLPDGTSLYLSGTASGPRAAQAIGPVLPFWDRQIDLGVLLAGDDPALADLTDLAGRVAFRQVIVPGEGIAAVTLQRWQAIATQRATRTTILDSTASPATLQLGNGARLTLYSLPGVPKQGRAAALAPTVALRLELGPAALLFASALPADQARLAALGVPLSAQVLKLVGTGARWGLDPGFFQQANPSVVILPSGVASQFARPTPGTLDLLANRQVYRTDQDGTIIVSVATQGLHVRTDRGQ
jgi:competence protein ComEC